jgi:anti-sigma factor RsiW
VRCEDVFDNLTDLLDGALPADVEAAALEHLATCERCEITLAETRSLLDLAVDDRPVELDPPTRASLLSRIVAEVRTDS